MQKIVVNGMTYSGPEEMPPDIRKIYEETMGILADKKQDGIPGIVNVGSRTSLQIENTPIRVNKTSMNISVDGKVYSRVEDLPPAAREKYQQAMAKIGQAFGDADHNGVPDILEGVMPAASGFAEAELPFAETSIPSTAFPPPAPVVSDANPPLRWLILGGILAILVGLGFIGTILALLLLK